MFTIPNTNKVTDVFINNKQIINLIITPYIVRGLPFLASLIKFIQYYDEQLKSVFLKLTLFLLITYKVF